MPSTSTAGDKTQFFSWPDATKRAAEVDAAIKRLERRVKSPNKEIAESAQLLIDQFQRAKTKFFETVETRHRHSFSSMTTTKLADMGWKAGATIEFDLPILQQKGLALSKPFIEDLTTRYKHVVISAATRMLTDLILIEACHQLSMATYKPAPVQVFIVPKMDLDDANLLTDSGLHPDYLLGAVSLNDKEGQAVLRQDTSPALWKQRSSRKVNTAEIKRRCSFRSRGCGTGDNVDGAVQ
ncbi:hypothetical protein C8J56DRAFT_1082531 [Mycena floridula]|nr:hypothetical protein C8J56DRAFT_1082531 [Mycena floridula]